MTQDRRTFLKTAAWAGASVPFTVTAPRAQKAATSQGMARGFVFATLRRAEGYGLGVRTDRGVLDVVAAEQDLKEGAPLSITNVLNGNGDLAGLKRCRACNWCHDRQRSPRCHPHVVRKVPPQTAATRRFLEAALRRSGRGRRIRRVRKRRAVAVVVLLSGPSGFLAGCGGHPTASPKATQAFLNAVYSNAPDISSYRSSRQLVSLGQVVCDDLESGASVQEVGDRIPLIEGSVSLPPGDLGVVISAAVGKLCPRFRRLLGQ